MLLQTSSSISTIRILIVYILIAVISYCKKKNRAGFPCKLCKLFILSVSFERSLKNESEIIRLWPACYHWSKVRYRHRPLIFTVSLCYRVLLPHISQTNTFKDRVSAVYCALHVNDFPSSCPILGDPREKSNFRRSPSR